MKLIRVEHEQSDLASLMEEAQHDRIVVEQNGKPVGVILSLEDYCGTLDAPESPEIRELFNSPELKLKLQRFYAFCQLVRDYLWSRSLRISKICSKDNLGPVDKKHRISGALV